MGLLAKLSWLFRLRKLPWWVLLLIGSVLLLIPDMTDLLDFGLPIIELAGMGLAAYKIFAKSDKKGVEGDAE